MSEVSQFNGLKIFVSSNGIRTIVLNRPKKKNAFSMDMYSSVVSALNEAAVDQNTKFVVITGAGDYFSSGNDLSNFTNTQGREVADLVEEGAKELEKFVAAFIKFPKLLFAVVNGPAVGIMVTVLGLCDVVYATESANFVTPFSKLGQSPEGCSSFTFTRMMNRGRALEMLCFNKQISAHEAQEVSLVTRVFADVTFKKDVASLLQSYSELPIGSLNATKKLIRQYESEILLHVNKSEVDQLRERWMSDECMEAVLKFFQNKSKL